MKFFDSRILLMGFLCTCFCVNAMEVHTRLKKLFVEVSQTTDLGRADEVEQQAKDDIQKLIDGGSDINVCDQYNKTQLMAAALTGCSSIVALLIDKGADVRLTDDKKHNAFAYVLLGLVARQLHPFVSITDAVRGSTQKTIDLIGQRLGMDSEEINRKKCEFIADIRRRKNRKTCCCCG